MFPIVNKQILAPDIRRIDVLAPVIARKIRPAQFVSVTPEEEDESIPLTVVDSDPHKGTISLIFQEIGATTKKLGALTLTEPIFSVLGPLGVPAEIQKVGVVVCIATGMGSAQILPVCRAFQKCGNKVIGIIGAKTKRSLVVESQMRIACEKIFITTNDGSYERRGLATDVLAQVIKDREVNLVYTIGSVDMMRAVCDLTRTKNIKTRVQLNPIMVDCMGMCGSCRVKIGNEIVLACLDGPEFDGHKVDFDDFEIRMKVFEENKEWHNRPVQIKAEKKESKTLTRFLSGILGK